jgi:hypothetical protein
METVTGIFTTREETERAVAHLRKLGIDDGHINILTPGSGNRELGAVQTSDTEQPGMGAALGGLVGGVSGLTIGTAAASLLIPGVGPVTAIGILAAALFGAGGVAAGVAAGDALEESMSDGLPKDELFLYEDALRQGRTVMIVTVDDKSLTDRVREALREEGVESVDAAHDRWWIGLRDVEAEHYRSTGAGADFERDEKEYRRGFVAALHPRVRGKAYEEALDELRESHPEAYGEHAFQRGYERGREYSESVRRHDAN